MFILANLSRVYCTLTSVCQAVGAYANAGTQYVLLKELLNNPLVLGSDKVEKQAMVRRCADNMNS